MTKAVQRRVVFRWDLDKTYLETKLESLRSLAKIPFESAEEKVAAPGVAALIRGLRSSAERRGDEVRVRFVSGSPPQISKAILEKLAMDGIEHDGVTFKDQWSRLRRGKFRDLREQVGYKVTELLRHRAGEPEGAEEFLFGDDWESDPLIYSLYADIVAGHVEMPRVQVMMRELGVDRKLAKLTEELAAEVPKRNAVARIFIHLARPTPPQRFAPYGPRLVPTFNYLQTAACLFDQGVLDAESVGAVIRDLRDTNRYSSAQLVNSLRDIERRASLSEEGAARLVAHARKSEILPQIAEGRSRWRDLWLRARGYWRRGGRCREDLLPGPAAYDVLIPSIAGDEREQRIR